MASRWQYQDEPSCRKQPRIKNEKYFEAGIFIRFSNQQSNRSTMFQTSSIMSKTVNQLALSLALCPTLIAFNPAQSKPVICSPNNGSTKVLAKPSPTSPPAKGWGPGNSIGTAWQLVKNKEQTFGQINYIQGKLLSPFSPRAGYSYEQYLAAKGQEVWGILSEWNCQWLMSGYRNHQILWHQRSIQQNWIQRQFRAPARSVRSTWTTEVGMKNIASSNSHRHHMLLGQNHWWV